MFTPRTRIVTDPFVAEFRLKTARVNVAPPSNEKPMLLKGSLLDPAVITAWPEASAFRAPPDDTKETPNRPELTVPVTTETLVASLSRTLSVPWLLTPTRTTISARAVKALPNVSAMKARAIRPAFLTRCISDTPYLM